MSAKKKGNAGWFKIGVQNVRKGTGGVKFICLVCNKKCHKRKSNKKSKYLYCSSKCIGLNLRGKLHHAWKGDKAGKRSIHLHMQRYYGIGKVCELCGKKSKFIDWASKGHKYTRIRKDWLLLCRKCHKNYDKRQKER